MKVVIDIDEDYYELIEHDVNINHNDFKPYNIIANGIPLPKGHGDLIILSNDELKENLMNLDFSCKKWISEIGLSNATIAIIEADKAESEEE